MTKRRLEGVSVMGCCTKDICGLGLLNSFPTTVGDVAEADGMVIVSGQPRHAVGRAECRVVHLCVTQAALRQLVQGHLRGAVKRISVSAVAKAVPGIWRRAGKSLKSLASPMGFEPVLPP